MKMMKKKSILFFFIVLFDFLPFLLSAQEKAKIRDDNDVIYYLIGAAAILLIVIVTLAVVMISSGNKDKTLFTSYGNGLVNRSSPSRTPESTNIKKSSPSHDTSTLKLLPGHLEVVGGDDSLKKIQFHKMNNEAPEITFGRKSGPPHTHVHLKSKTVSLAQAKLIYTNGKYLLINYSDINPTRVDGEPLPEDGSVFLEEGNKIKMGEVSFIFHEE